jgi:hypothetical protein
MQQTIMPHVQAWRKWRTASDAIDNTKVTTPAREAKRHAKILKLKAEYERLLALAKAAGEV